MKDLIEKYETQAEVLLKIMQSTYSNEEEIEKAAAARRFVTGFIYDLKALDSNELPIIEDLELFELQIEQTMDFIDVSKENKDAWKMGFKSGFKIALTPNPFI